MTTQILTTDKHSPPQVLASLITLASAEADADAFYGVYGPSLYYHQPHYPFSAPGFVAPPLLRTYPAPSVRRVAAVPAVVTKTVQAAPAPSLIAKVGRLSQV